MKKAMCKGTLVLPNMKLPVSVYVGSDTYGISGHQFHRGCDGRIGMYTYCTLCGEESPEIYSAVQIGDQLVEVTTDNRKALLERDITDFVVESSHKMTEIPWLMQQMYLVPNRLLELQSQRSQRSIIEPHESLFVTLISRLAIKKRFLLLSLPSGNMKRYAILMPTDSGVGQLYTLSYVEELRQFDIPEAEVDNHYRNMIDDTIDQLSGDFPMISAEHIILKINKWFEMKLSGRKIEAVTGSKSKKKVKV